jgi:hypothetical protein
MPSFGGSSPLAPPNSMQAGLIAVDSVLGQWLDVPRRAARHRRDEAGGSSRMTKTLSAEEANAYPPKAAARFPRRMPSFAVPAHVIGDQCEGNIRCR